MIKLFTHTDLDGVSCFILAKLAFDDDVSVTFCNYDDINEKVSEFLHDPPISVDEIHITDISINDTIATTIDDSDVVCRLFDHHSTASYLNKYKWCVVEESLTLTNLKTAGTELYYLYLYNNGLLCKYNDDCLRKFVEVVRDYDTWRWATLGEDGKISKKLNDLLYIYGRDDFVYKYVYSICTSAFPRLSQADNLILDIEQKKINDYISLKNDQMIRRPFLGNICGFVFADKYISELGNELCKMNPDVDFVAIIDIGKCAMSYRTIRDDINLGEEIAKPLGGGGHPKAAASRFSKDIGFEIVKALIGC